MAGTESVRIVGVNPVTGLDEQINIIGGDMLVSGSGPVYGDWTSITAALGGLANNAYWQSDYIDFEALGWLDAYIGGSISSGAVAPTLGNSIVIYGYALIGEPGASPVYTAGASGSSSLYTSDGEVNLLGIVKSFQVTTDTARAYVFGPCSFCEAMGLRALPKRGGVMVNNASGQALAAADASHYLGYYGVR